MESGEQVDSPLVFRGCEFGACDVTPARVSLQISLLEVKLLANCCLADTLITTKVDEA